MSDVKVSVIIPVYNMEKYLRECLDSVARQSFFNDIEVVCVNDGSVDDSQNILNEYAARYKNFLIINQKNQGVGIARNNGIKKASGEFIAFMDSDDTYFENNTLELLYTKAKENNVLICGGSFCESHDDEKWLNKRFSGINEKFTFQKEAKIQYKDYQFDYGYYRFIFNRKFLIENEIFFSPLIRFQDPPFFVKAMIAAKEFYAVPNITYCYRVGHQHTVWTWNERRVCDLIIGLTENLKLSVNEKLGELHAITLTRFSVDYKPQISEAIRNGSKKVLNLLFDAEKNVDKRILQENCEIKSVYQIFYDGFGELQKGDPSIRNSLTYKVGNIVLFVPKKIKRLIKGR